MLDLYTARSPVVFKVLIALEEMGLAFRSIPVDVTKGEQYAEAFTAVNPNAKIPALVDDAPADGGAPIALGESGAILVYLAEKTGRFLPSAARQRAEVLQWVFWQMASLGPTMGQTRHFRFFAREHCAYSIERFGHEAARLYGVLDKRLAGREYVCGDYSIADIACWPWLLFTKSNGLDLDAYANVARWFRHVASRPAVERVAQAWWEGLPIELPMPLEREAQRILFGWKD
jgi:GST-like protein